MLHVLPATVDTSQSGQCELHLLFLLAQRTPRPDGSMDRKCREYRQCTMANLCRQGLLRRLLALYALLRQLRVALLMLGHGLL